MVMVCEVPIKACEYSEVSSVIIVDVEEIKEDH